MNPYTKIHFTDDIGGTFKVLNNPERLYKVEALVKKPPFKTPVYSGLVNIAKGQDGIKEQALYYVNHIIKTGLQYQGDFFK